MPATLHLSTSVRLPAAENPAPAPRRTSPYRRLVAPAARAAVVAAGTATAALALLLPVAPAAPAALAAPAPTPVVTAPVVAAPIELAAVAAPAAVPVAPAATRASALQNAMSKIGSPYRYGAAGPVAFDCSGLVNWAYKAAGVALPRTSRQLSTIGTPVAKADLQPGDLVFFYRPISHVAIYIGDGKVVHASNRRDPVKISNLAAMPFTAARRV